MIEFIFGILFVIAVFMLIAAVYKGSNTEEISKLEHYYNRYLYAYKIKVLRDEFKARKVSVTEMHAIIKEVLTGKPTGKHVLKQIEEEVKGEADLVSPKTLKEK